MMHSFCRLILAWLGLYRIEIGAQYFYANNGPFDEAHIYALDAKQGFVQYAVERGEIRTTHWTSDSTFAFMCRKYKV